LILNKASSIYTKREGGVFLARNLSVNTLLNQGGGILPLINNRFAVAAGQLSPFFSRGFSTSSFKQQNRSKLDSLSDSFPSLFENLHSYTTTNIKECSLVLSKMYNSLTDPVVKLYIQNNCLHLISLDKHIKGGVNTPQTDFIDYVVDGQDKQGHPSLYTGKAGCYAFLCLKTNDYYVGSAVCLNTRYKAHKVNSSRPERGGSNSLYLSVRKHG
jgi:hypothetical protein